jgi:uncharacterized protein (TIGR03083 family)
VPDDALDPTAAYRGVRLRVTELVGDLPVEALDRAVPATPGWRVRDVVAHLAGATADIVAGNLEGVASDEWTAAQVDARRATPITDVLDEWARCSATVDPLIPEIPSAMRGMLITDAVTHEHDVRGALDRPGARDTDALAYAFRAVSRGIGSQRGGAGALRLVHDAGETVVGEGAPSAAVRTTRFEVVRAAVGRRSLDQIGAWDWEGDARPETVVLSRFSPPRATPLDE